MDDRLCPECDGRTSEPVCPACGAKTLMLPSPDDADPLLGRVIDERYRVESLLGRGGMGAVYRAHHLAMGKPVAVKVVRPELGGTVDAARRFHREARAASLLSHPHTIRVFDFGQMPDRTLYMVMELLDGRSLARVIADGPLGWERAVRVASEVAQSLVEAHEHGLVHRDLKPENIILLDTAGHPDFVKVLDFGIAKVLTGSSGVSSVTESGAVVGTPYYMAPEQASAPQGITNAVDVYALGVLLYEMLTGHLPFMGDTPMEVLMAHVTRPAPDLPADVAVPAALRDLLARMLSKEADRRPTAVDLLADLAALRASADTDVRPTVAAPSVVLPPRPFPWWAVGLAALVLAGLLGAGWFVLGARAGSPSPAQPPVATPPAPAPAVEATPAVAPSVPPTAAPATNPAPPSASAPEAAPAPAAPPAAIVAPEPIPTPPPARAPSPAKPREPAGKRVRERPEMLDL